MTNCTYCQRETFKTVLPWRRGDQLRTRDHVVPLSKGGQDCKANRVISCLRCNGLKSDMMPDEWQAYMQANPRWWERTRFERKAGRDLETPLPMEHSQYILTNGKRAYRKARALGATFAATKEAPLVCPVLAMVAQFFCEKRYGVWKQR